MIYQQSYPSTLYTLRVPDVVVKKKKPQSKQTVMDSCLSYFSILKMETNCSSEASVDFHWTTRCYIPEYRTLHNHRCVCFKRNIGTLYFKIILLIFFFK
jgi:hypothetical protein